MSTVSLDRVLQTQPDGVFRASELVADICPIYAWKRGNLETTRPIEKLEVVAVALYLYRRRIGRYGDYIGGAVPKALISRQGKPSARAQPPNVSLMAFCRFCKHIREIIRHAILRTMVAEAYPEAVAADREWSG